MVRVIKQGGARLSRDTRRQGWLTLAPISEETDKDKKYGICWQPYQLRLTLSPTVPSGRKLREGVRQGNVRTKHQGGTAS